MLSTPFCWHIIHYDPPRGFLVPKFSTYDGSSDPFDHIMHYRQLMTLDIGNSALLCKIFPTSLQVQALSWFHRLPPNSVDNFRDLSEAFVGQYLCSTRHKQNINTLQNIKMQENESLREFVKWFGQAVLQVEACSMDVVLQIFKRSICPCTLFFKSLVKKPPATMDDFHPANLGCRTGIQKWCGKKCQTSGPARVVRSKVGEIEPSGTAAPHTPLHILREAPPYDPRPIQLQRHFLKSQLRILATPKAIINYIHGGPLDEEYDSKRKRQRLLRAASIRERVNSIRPGIAGGGPQPIDGTIIFPLIDPTRILQPHREALILSLGMGDFDVRRILIDPGSSTDLLQTSVIGHMGRDLSGLENLGRILSGFNGVVTTSLRDIVLPVQAGSVTLNVQFLVVQDLSPFNAILGLTWLHYMKVIPSTYYQMVSFLTEDGQIDLHGSQLVVRQCYQIAREAGTSQEDRSLPEPPSPTRT
uniref:Retrotransposon gag domain-containing protein n=1 Tax=Vitis vinifera TaxID=29760 RepID=A5AHF7_VITVI|nr:hypothetical protein VITISV_035227 [Vitis vinifera]